jgi:putative FmdB family regulatory protein
VPTYSYACTECGHRFEAVQAFSESSLTVCPACSGKLRKVFSSVGIVFKGSGFYRTDSRAGAVPKGESKSEKGSESKGSDSKGSDSKGSEGGGSGSKRSEGTSSGKGSDGGSEKSAPAKTESSGGKAGATAGSSSSSAPTKGA